MEKFKIKLFYFLFSNVLFANFEGQLTLQDSIALAERNNLELKQIREQMLIGGLKKTAHSHRYHPKLKPISLSSEFSGTPSVHSGLEMDLPTGAQIAFDYDHKIFEETPNYHLSLSQPLSHNTKPHDDQITALRLELDRLSKEKQYHEKLFSIAKKYRECVSDQLSQNQQTQLINSLKTRLHKQKIEYKHGLISKSELDKVMLAVATESSEIIERTRKVNNDLLELKNALGIDESEKIKIELNQNFKITSFDLKHAKQLAIQNNLDFKIERIREEITHLQHLKSQSLSKPKFALYGQVGNQSDAKLGLKVEFRLPSEEQEINEAESHLNFSQSIESSQHKKSTLLRSVNEKVNSLHYQEKLLTISAKKLENAQSIFEADVIKMKYNLLSDDEFQVTTKNLKSAYQDSVQSQIRYQNLQDELQFMLGSNPYSKQEPL